MSGSGLIGAGIGYAVGKQLASGPPDSLAADLPTTLVCVFAGMIIGEVVGTTFAEQEERRRAKAKYELSA